MSILFAILFLHSAAQAESCPYLQGNFLACTSTLVGDSEAKEFLINQDDNRFTIDSVERDGLFVAGKSFVADGGIVKTAASTMQASCAGNALVQNEVIFLQGNPFLSFTAKYYLTDEDHLQLDVYMDATAIKPTKSIRCIRFR